MLFSLTRPGTPESSWVRSKLPKRTRHLMSFFPLPYTQVLLYSNNFFSFAPYATQLAPSVFFFTILQLT